MQPVYAVVLGAIQGLTEFLPVSSSGHLVILQHLLGMRSPELIFDVAVHLGTLGAVMIVFRSDVAGIARALKDAIFTVLHGNRSVSRPGDGTSSHWLRLSGLIAAGSIPTAVIGLGIHFGAEEVFASPLTAGLLLVVTGALLMATRMAPGGRKGLDDIAWGDALLIGLVQGIAVFPGISRSGSTIAAALFLGVERDAAARFSFLLSIPSILGAALLVAGDLSHVPDGSARTALIGALVSAAVGYAALRMLVYIVNRGRLHMFAPYCWAVGALGVLLAWID